MLNNYTNNKINTLIYDINMQNICIIVRDIIIIRKVPKKRRTRIDFKPFLFLRHIVCCL